MDYPLPPWLSPNAAQGWGGLALDAAKSRANIQMERDRLSQQAATASMEAQQRSQETAQANQAKAQQLDYEHTMEQQKIAIETQYKQQQIGLQTQDLELAQKKFDAQTQQAAQMALVQHTYAKRVAAGEDPQKVIMELGPEMHLPPAALVQALKKPFSMGATVPVPGHPELDGVQTSPNNFRLIPKAPTIATNAPAAIPVPGENGEPIGHWVIPPGGGKAHWQVSQKTGGQAEMDALIKSHGGGNSSTAVDAKAPPARKAEGGYKIGAKYKGGLTYLGGPPGDEASWEKTK